jgi:hypothetical protein
MYLNKYLLAKKKGMAQPIRYFYPETIIEKEV